MNWPRSALACTAALTVLAALGLTPQPAKAVTDIAYVATWVDGPTVKNAGPRECLRVLGGNMTNGTAVVTWNCNGHPDQAWETLNVFSGSWVQIRNTQNPNKCLGVLKSATTNGSSLVIWDCNSNGDQLWAIEPWSANGSNYPDASTS
jgi:hypothetical protein